MILVTGAHGFIGQALVRALRRSRELAAPSGGLSAPRRELLAPGCELLTPTRQELDLTDADAVAGYLRRHEVQAVIHAATQPGHRNAPDPTRLLERNTRMFFNLVRAMDPQARMLFLGSGAVYDVRQDLDAVPESAFGRSIPADEHGFSKYICARFMEDKDRFQELRLFGVFGPGEDPLIRFISNAVCKALLGLPITCRQDRRFSYLWVEDLAPVLSALLAGPRSYAALNVVPDAPVSLVEAARRVLAVTGAEVPLQVAEPGLGLAYSGSNARLRARLPELAFTPLDPAILRLADYYRARLPRLDREAFKVDK